MGAIDSSTLRSPADSGGSASWALLYAALGWRVYPAERGGKKPIYSGWVEAATTDPSLIRRWWRRSPGAPNIGVVAGERFDVFDIEAEHVDALREVARRQGLPVTPAARSGGHGLHVYVAPLRLGTRRLLLEGVHVGELKGSGGVVVPPSVTRAPYRWLRSPLAVAVAEAPAWLVGLVAPPPKATAPDCRRGVVTLAVGAARLAALARAVRDASEGSRNSILYWAMRRALDEGVPAEVAASVLSRMAIGARLDEREVRATIGSAQQASAR